MDRDPCPWRLVDDAGGGFAIGLVGGTIWHFFGGLRNAPQNLRLSEAVSRVQVRVPITAGGFAIWATIFSIFDCSISYYRKKEDPFNAILSGAATGGFLAARAGVKAMMRNAAMGGVILAGIEGLSIGLNRVVIPYFERVQLEKAGLKKIDLLDPPVDPFRPRKYRPQNVISSTYQPSPLYQPEVSNSSIDDSLSDDWTNKQTKENNNKPFWQFW
mmetsp:Transcript_9852/g.8800  ORF Transcript_9852/g.8800 Transcript_9852/m.8800 type:complete len:215 (-) Transcript_9852:5251-5895(-)